MSDGIVRDFMDLKSGIVLSGSVQESIELMCGYFEVDFFTLHLFRGSKDAVDSPYVRTNYPNAWVSHYLLNDYIKIDPVLKRAQEDPAPFCWSTLTLELDQLKMMEQAIAHGVGQTGFTITHVDRIGRRSVLSFNAKEAKGADTWKPFLVEQESELAELASDMHLKSLSELYGETEELPLLSPRECECLRWTAEGKAHTDIAIILGLSEHTVRSYLKVARIKLDSMTLAQAVAKASSLGLI